MEFQLLYWHWLIFGAILIVSELALTSFTALWFGLGGMFVALCLFLFPELSLSVQILLWVTASIVCTVLWFKVLKPRMTDKTMTGLARESIIGQVGLVTKVPIAGGRGELRFSVPIIGTDTWSFICEDDVAPGDRVSVLDIIGNSLKAICFFFSKSTNSDDSIDCCH